MNHVKNKYGFLSEEEQQEITKRQIICNSCPYNSKNAVEAGWYTTDRMDTHCTHCGCNIELKTESLSSNCGIEAYNNKNPNNKLELFWTYFKPTENAK